MTSGRFVFVFALVATFASATLAQGQVATFQQELTGDVPGALFGRAVDVDGNTAVVGSPAENGFQGAADVYVRTGTTWTFVQRLQASDAAPSSQFGGEVAISDGTIVVGARTATVGSIGTAGAAYVFVPSGSAWIEQVKLVPSDSSSGANFGWAIAIDGDVLAISANTSSLGATQRGQAYVFERSGTTWTEHALVTPGLAANDFFGSAIGVSGTTVCVGVNGDDVGSNNGQGSAYVFTRSGTNWVMQQQLVASDGAANEGFGGSCAVAGDTVVVGAAGEDRTPSTNQGAAYVFVRSGALWSQQRKLVANDAAANDIFGVVAIEGDTAVVSAQGDESSRGSAYLFDRSGGTWTFRQKVEPPSGASLEYFGAGVAISGTALLIGAPSTSASARPGRVIAYSMPGAQTGAPGAPTSFQASASGNTVNMSWGAPTSGGVPTGYTVVARTTPGGPVLVTLPVGNLLHVGVAAPDGTFVVSVVATNAAGTGPESAGATVVVPQDVPSPGAPSGLAASVAGTTAVFTWSAPASGGAPTGYTLVAGTSPGFATPLVSMPLPASPRSATVSSIPPGTYYVRIVAQNAGGASAASNEVPVTVAGATTPGAPTLNVPTVSGNSVTVSWSPGAGGAPTSYTLTATATPGGVPIATVPLTGVSAGFTGVPSGTYYLQLTASNGAGTSAPSNQVTVVVP